MHNGFSWNVDMCAAGHCAYDPTKQKIADGIDTMSGLQTQHDSRTMNPHNADNKNENSIDNGSGRCMA
jgi:hypothetical protein